MADDADTPRDERDPGDEPTEPETDDSPPPAADPLNERDVPVDSEAPSDEEPSPETLAEQRSERERQAPMWLLVISVAALVFALVMLFAGPRLGLYGSEEELKPLQAQQELQQIENAVQEFARRHQRPPWPEDGEPTMRRLLVELDPEAFGNATPAINTEGVRYLDTDKLVVGGNGELYDPWRRPYEICRDPDGNGIAIYSRGPDGHDYLQRDRGARDDIGVRLGVKR